MVPADVCPQPASPFFLRMRSTFEPVTDPTWGTPWESRRTTPIMEGVMPLRDILVMISSTCSRKPCSRGAASKRMTFYIGRLERFEK